MKGEREAVGEGTGEESGEERQGGGCKPGNSAGGRKSGGRGTTWGSDGGGGERGEEGWRICVRRWYFVLEHCVSWGGVPGEKGVIS